MATFLKLPEVAAMFGVHQTSVIRWCKTGKFVDPLVIGQRYFFHRDEVMSFISRTTK